MYRYIIDVLCFDNFSTTPNVLKDIFECSHNLFGKLQEIFLDLDKKTHCLLSWETIRKKNGNKSPITFPK